MSKIKYIILMVIWLSGCTTSKFILIDGSLDIITINIKDQLYNIDGKQKKIIDCGSSDFNCIILEGIGPIAMIKQCTNFSDNFAVVNVDGIFKIYAPAPHLAQPAASFYNSQNKKILYYFNHIDGLHQIDIYNDALNSNAPDNTVKKYALKSSDGMQLFNCI